MRRLRRIKILATLGPASSDSAMIRRLFEAGADVFRINMSHTSHDKMRELVKTIRNVESSYGRPIGILVDLQGPKLRLGSFAEGSIQLNNGESFVLDSDKTPGDHSRVQLPHPEILAALRPGHALLLDDGKVRLIVEEASPDRAVTRVVIGGKMSDRKGVSLPDTDLPVSAMTPKDRADLEAALVTGVDWIALSFVQRAEDVVEAKKLIRGRAAVMSKIEKPQAIDRLPEILEASDALMVARGDLGVELPLERVPSLQKQMTRLARRAGKPVVVATQMLESMIQSPVPTRAEVSDVATAVYEGADAIMLSAESAAGKFPVEAVSTMNRIGEEVERDPTYRGARTDRRRRDRRRRAANRRNARSQRDHLLDQFRVDRAARRARAAEAASGGDHAEPRHRAQAVRGVGRTLRRRRGRAGSRRHGQPRRLNRFSRRLCQGGTARHHRRRRAARRSRHHQHAAHRLRGPERRRGYVSLPPSSPPGRIKDANPE
jgi:pyruvate kinase